MPKPPSWSPWQLELGVLPDTNLGLRERKKLRTRAAIQKQAMRLFLEKGYDETTIEDIAEAVEISPSTFFNYFPSKEEVVFMDDLDQLLLTAIDAEPAQLNPIGAMRHAMRKVLSHLTPEQKALVGQRLRLMSSNSSLRAAFLNQYASQVDQIVAVLAHRTGRPADDFAVRNLAGALLGVMITTFLGAAPESADDVVEEADRAMAHLEAGLPLDWPPRE